jgi:ubiquinone/menaquinone biosynthesis C-methylase UbiE
MQDPEILFSKLELKQKDVILDLGCGAGDYSLYASKLISSGKIYALDMQKNILDALEEEAIHQDIHNISTQVYKIPDKLNLEDQSIDVCFIATVLHALDLERVSFNLFKEIRRVLKTGGRLVILECNNNRKGFGPPSNRRISALKLKELLGKYGFEEIRCDNLGYNYLSQFK